MPLITKAFSREELKNGFIIPLAVHPNGRRAYIGRGGSTERERCNLGVLKLDEHGNSHGELILYRDCDLPLPIDATSSVIRLHLHSTGHKLYIVSLLRYLPYTSLRQPRLTVYDLDEQGDPVGAPRSYDAGFPLDGTIFAIAEHPFLNLLYLAGDEASVRVFPLDIDGEPQGPAKFYPIGTNAKTEAAVSPDGKLLYLGTMQHIPSGTPPDVDALEIVPLDLHSGVPETSTLQSFPAGHAPGETNEHHLEFHYTPKALYRRQPIQRDFPNPDLSVSPPPWPLVVWRLNASGYPIDASGQLIPSDQPLIPQTFPEYSGRAIAVDESSNYMWIVADDTFTDAFNQNKVVRDGVSLTRVVLDGTGLPTEPSKKFLTKYGQEGQLIDASADQRLIMVTQALTKNQVLPGDVISGNQVKDYYLRLKVRRAELKSGPAPTTFTFLIDTPQFSISPVPVETLALNQLSQPVALDLLKGGTPPTDHAPLKDKDFQVLFQISLTPDPATQLDLAQVQVDIYQGNPVSGGILLKSMTDTVRGNIVEFLLPGYGFLPPGKRLEAIELMSQHSKQYLFASEQVAVKPAERPTQFSVSCYCLRGGQGHLDQLKTGAAAMANLGFNNLMADNWKGLPFVDDPLSVDETLKAAGLTRRLQAEADMLEGFRPQADDFRLVNFDFYLKSIPLILQQWAVTFPNITQANGGKAEEVDQLAMRDEPNWDYPATLDLVTPSYLTEFRDYLFTQKGLPSGFFDPEPIVPTGASAWMGVNNPSLEVRKLFYWTMRFFTESCSLGFARASSAIENAFGHPLSVYVDLNRPVSNWYTATPIFDNTKAGLDNAIGAPDWLDAGRRSAYTLWMDTSFFDDNLQLWSLYGDALRSAASLGSQEFGAYVRGSDTGAHPEGVSYAFLSLIGHGAKLLDFYPFGPWFIFGDGWSEHWDVYRPLANAMRLVGRAEKLLYPGRPSRGKVALLLPGTSSLWDQSSNQPTLYQNELWGLHFALVHAGYTVDFVDDTDIAQGELQKRSYTTLYITGPNVSRAAQSNIDTWVHDDPNGRVLAVTPGAATHDEYNDPSSVLDNALGLGARTENRLPVTDVNRQNFDRVIDEVTLTDSAFFGSGNLPLFEPVAPLPRIGATAAETLQKMGGAAITRNQYGFGQVIAYGFFPGQQYLKSPNQDAPAGAMYGFSRLPSKWGSLQRSVAIAPAWIANTPKPVVLSHELVEACKLESSQGTAIVLLNWSDVPIPMLKLSLPVPIGFTDTVSSAQEVDVESYVSDGDLNISLPLGHVDVVMIE